MYCTAIHKSIGNFCRCKFRGRGHHGANITAPAPGLRKTHGLRERAARLSARGRARPTRARPPRGSGALGRSACSRAASGNSQRVFRSPGVGAAMFRTPRVPRRYVAPRCAQKLARVGSLPRDAGRALARDRRSRTRYRRDLTEYCASQEQASRITGGGQTGQTDGWLRGPARLVRDRPDSQNVFRINILSKPNTRRAGTLGPPLLFLLPLLLRLTAPLNHRPHTRLRLSSRT
eukprot:gene12946-biopygen1226